MYNLNAIYNTMLNLLKQEWQCEPIGNIDNIFDLVDPILLWSIQLIICIFTITDNNLV